MQSVAVGWQVYEITHRPLDWGSPTGAILPGVVLFLLAGHVADRFDRRNLLTLCYVGFAVSSALLLVVALNAEYLHRAGSVAPIFAILCLVGAVRSFSMPASRALLPQLCGEQFQSAVAWNSSIFQFATILGPAMGEFSTPFSAARPRSTPQHFRRHHRGVTTLRIKVQSPPRAREPFSLEPYSRISLHLGSQIGFRLDLAGSFRGIARRCGGAAASLCQRNIGDRTVGTGIAAQRPGIGAAVMALLIAYKPIRRRAGATMLWCVAGFGSSRLSSAYRATSCSR